MLILENEQRQSRVGCGELDTNPPGHFVRLGARAVLFTRIFWIFARVILIERLNVELVFRLFFGIGKFKPAFTTRSHDSNGERQPVL